MKQYDLTWTAKGWEDYISWQQAKTGDKKKLEKVNALIKDILRTPFDGIGQPEQLTGDLSDCWSRHIDSKNRIVYRVQEDRVVITNCRTHYGDK